MATIFLSHSSTDKSEARLLKRWLEEEERGHSVFLDDDLQTGIKGGEDWERALYKQLRVSRVFLPLLTRNWIDSKWCFAEMVYARSTGKMIVPVKIDKACDTDAAFGDIQQIEIDSTGADRIGYDRLDHALREAFPLGRPETGPLPGPNGVSGR